MVWAGPAAVFGLASGAGTGAPSPGPGLDPGHLEQPEDVLVLRRRGAGEIGLDGGPLDQAGLVEPAAQQVVGEARGCLRSRSSQVSVWIATTAS